MDVSFSIWGNQRFRPILMEITAAYTQDRCTCDPPMSDMFQQSTLRELDIFFRQVHGVITEMRSNFPQDGLRARCKYHGHPSLKGTSRPGGYSKVRWFSDSLGFSNHGFMARNCPPKKQWLETARMKHDRSLEKILWIEFLISARYAGADRSETERAVWHWAGSHRRKRLMTGANLL